MCSEMDAECNGINYINLRPRSTTLLALKVGQFSRNIPAGSGHIGQDAAAGDVLKVNFHTSNDYVLFTWSRYSKYH